MRGFFPPRMEAVFEPRMNSNGHEWERRLDMDESHANAARALARDHRDTATWHPSPLEGERGRG